MVTMNFMGWDHTAAEIKRLKAGKDVIDFRAHFIYACLAENNQT